MKLSTLVITCVGVLAVAGCQSTKPLSPQEQARQTEYDRENTRVALADCALVDVLNKRRIKSHTKRISAPDCIYLKKKGTLQGFDGKGLRLPNLMIGGIPIPIGTVVALGQAAERAGNRNRAMKADLSGSVASPDAAIVVRKMMLRGYTQEEAIAASGTAAFANTISATRRARVYLKANRKS